ncbi:hypothetical protein VNO80_21093 [Phaseolus coccineus]|uniref:Uncharacterized protein n=1 Tax=Phaseolus coccineus TaxID=3886 RepID=A0AAN9M376_PHACN
MGTPTLIGPPELYIAKPTATLTQAAPAPAPAVTSTTPSDPFMDQMVAAFNTISTSNMTLTENSSLTFLTTGNPCLDFFFHVVPDTPPETLLQRLELAWAQSPLTALKLVCNLRDIRGSGKADRRNFYGAAIWLHRHHPKTLAANIPSVANFGYFKDLLEILYLLLEGSDARKTEWLKRKRGLNRSEETKTEKKQKGKTEALNERVDGAKDKTESSEKEIAHVAREEKRVALAKKLVDRYTSDPDFRFLHDRVSDYFAEWLRKDLEFLKSGSYNEYVGVEEAHYTYRVRDRLRKEVLVPLRKALELPEVEILEACAERFEAYVEDVKSGKSTIAAGALLPHEIIKSLDDGDGGDVAELQWKRVVDDLVKKGKMKSCLAVCDVSGSMTGVPMDVCVALGLLVSELCEEPWKGKVVTFSADPHLHLIEGDDLRSKTQFMRDMDWGMNTDFQVFDLILEVAVRGNLRPDQMIKRLFVFSDMEFDLASRPIESYYGWETNYQIITRKFEEKGFGDVVPQIIFWNLRDSKATPVPATQKGVALLSGFSKNLLTLFLDKEGELSPLEAMETAISWPEYQNLVVLD